MIKSEMAIEKDFYTMVKNSVLGSFIRGTIYRSGMRPKNATTEDLVIKFLSGLDSQIQSGVVIFNLYVPDVVYKKEQTKVADKNRIEELENKIIDFIGNHSRAEYLLSADTTPIAMVNEEIGQHFIYARIKFNRLTD